ncbi:MAG: hypothetical protein IKD10_13610 [Lentisphaeria bacterium]|nr:hypothetical protein [Lentisphaeria bacterium]
MSAKKLQRKPGQHKLSRYRHTQSCIRIAGFVPGKDREKAIHRCRVMAVIYLLTVLAGVIAIFR